MISRIAAEIKLVLLLQHIRVQILSLNAIYERISIGKKELRFLTRVMFLDEIIMPIIHQNFGQIQDTNYSIDWSIQC